VFSGRVCPVNFYKPAIMQYTVCFGKYALPFFTSSQNICAYVSLSFYSGLFFEGLAHF